MITFQEACHPIIGQEEIDTVVKVLQSGVLSDFKGSVGEQFYGGCRVREFEQAFALKFGVKFAVAFNSATAALHAACVACGIDFGDEVIVSPYTFTASASCVLMAHAEPVFADIDPDTFCIAPGSVREVITPQTRGIIPVHLFGHPVDMNEIMDIAAEYDLKVIEDSCQAIGAKYKGELTGTIGDCGVFSFQETKTISTGEGGMLITNNPDIYDKACAVRNHGEMLGGRYWVGITA